MKIDTNITLMMATSERASGATNISPVWVLSSAVSKREKWI